MIEADTIAAIATASGVGGVGIVRMSGPQAIAIAEDTLGAKLDRRVRVGWARDRSGERIDQVLAFAMHAPGSFTGEDLAELQGHGGTENLARLLAAVVARGARLAEPGEFTRRAVLNGKLDLARAEALLEVINAGSERALRQAQHNLAGKLGEAAEALEARVLVALAEIEGRIDFPEEGIAPADEAALERELTGLEARVRELANGFRHARAVQRGVTVALVGAVNVGKSSLLNALVGRERALVAAEPGTTRDYLEVATTWHGVAVTLIDTAGTRAAADPIEARGIALGESRVAEADVVVIVDDGSSEVTSYGDRTLHVRSKIDLSPAPSGMLGTSARTGEGLDELMRRALALAGVAAREGSEDALVTTERQHGLVVVAADALAAAVARWRGARIGEVIALELRQAASALARLRGVEVGERVLDEVFARFCIGK
ncbi:MAG TPA: tRNA uridine-5-carboxymethylaminomethyl(34) synthesis GTPase MnmE [Kofleriaceae bacterium]|jgi:tRNA modification GTPase|nr:tRNA uridine-5-carboxymethylaminomethyl(34) synthesis GTPase MnmE [Kofleriaceae bacterium]